MAQNRQKSYADVRRRDIEFWVDDWVFLKVSPMKGVMRFKRKGKLSPRYVRPYEVIRRIGQIAYEVDLPRELAAVTWYSMCRCYANAWEILHRLFP